MFRNYNFEVSIKNTIVFENCIVLFFKTNDYTIRVIILYLLKKIKNNKNERSRKWKYKMSDFSVVSVFNTYVLYTQNFSCFLDIVYFKLRHDNKFSAL